ncbi:methyl-accepting chemotaxis protein, partial [Xanthomonas sp. Kuri4-3]
MLGALALGLSVILLCALGGLASAWASLSNEVPREVAQSTQSEAISRDFRLQVQEWKNVLIRGRDPALLKKHLDAFETQGRKVQQGVQALAAALADP